MTTDPSIHRGQQEQFIAHVRLLLDDDRLRIDTSAGRRPVSAYFRDVNYADHAVDLKRVMSELGKPDRALENQMPQNRQMDVLLSRRSLFVFKRPVGRLTILCVSPTRALLQNQPPEPLSTGDIARLLSQLPPPLPGVPTTLVLMSTAGFEQRAHEMTERTAGRTLILAEPNKAGGWSVHGPPEMQALTELFDPEQEQQKRGRIRQGIADASSSLSAAGVTADKLVSTTHLPLPMIESELKAYAKEHPGLMAKRLDGRMVLFREGSMPQPAKPASSGGSDMPLIDRIRSLFSRQGENEKKIAFLSERRTLLSGQRDAAYEEMNALENQDAQLREEFKAARTPMTRKRITSQLLQLRKEMERRQQMLSVFNQQINVVGTHLHSIELVQQGQSAKLPDGDELAADAAAAEDMLAQLEAANEQAGTVSTPSLSGLTAEEQALYEQLEKESAVPTPATPSQPQQASSPPQRAAAPAAPQRISQPEAE